MQGGSKSFRDIPPWCLGVTSQSSQISFRESSKFFGEQCWFHFFCFSHNHLIVEALGQLKEKLTEFIQNVYATEPSSMVTESKPLKEQIF